jgi:hypothetical protein
VSASWSRFLARGALPVRRPGEHQRPPVVVRIDRRSGRAVLGASCPRAVVARLDYAQACWTRSNDGISGVGVGESCARENTTSVAGRSLRETGVQNGACIIAPRREATFAACALRAGRHRRVSHARGERHRVGAGSRFERRHRGLVSGARFGRCVGDDARVGPWRQVGRPAQSPYGALDIAERR